MHIIQILREQLETEDPKAYELYYQELDTSKYGNMINSEILNTRQRKDIRQVTHISNSANYIEYTNRTGESQNIKVGLDFSFNTLSDAFEKFTAITCHANSVSDFRVNKDKHKNLRTNNYFVHHGDGNCFQQSLYFQSFVDSKYKIDVMYTRNASGDFMHTYCSYKGIYLDPDQKTKTVEGDNIVLKGHIFQLLAEAGAKIALNNPEYLFTDASIKLNEMYRDNRKFVMYRKPSPSPEQMTKEFLISRIHHTEVVSMKSDDYAWKKNYKSQYPFFQDLKDYYNIEIPPNSKLSIGFEGNEPEEIRIFCCVYFGRIPLRIAMKTNDNGMCTFKTGTRPWMICTRTTDGIKKLNNKDVKLVREKKDQIFIIGGQELQQFAFNCESETEIQGKPHTEIDVYLPFNSYLMSSGISKFEANNSLYIKTA